ncbi:MAG: dienelactone hydrolase family protein [bacterium]
MKQILKYLNFIFIFCMVVLFSLLIYVFSLQRACHFPPLTGSYTVGTVLYHWKDKNRNEIYSEIQEDNRELRVQFWYPAAGDMQTALIHYPNEATDYLKKLVNETYKIPYFLLNRLNDVYIHAVYHAPLAKTSGKYPIIIVLHGITGLRTDYTAHCENLASNGYIVIGISHPYTSAVVNFADGRKIESFVTRENAGQYWDSETVVQQYWANELAVWTHDVQFVLDMLEKLDMGNPPSMFVGKIDLQRIGIMGHSFGGSVATQMCRIDSRIKACINLDGGLFTQNLSVGLDKPYMFMIAQGKIEGAKRHWSAGKIVDINKFFDATSKDAYMLTIKGAVHNSFTDYPLLLNSFLIFKVFNFFKPIHLLDANPIKISSIIDAYIVAFFETYLKDQSSVLLTTGYNKYEEVDIKKWTKKLPGPLPKDSLRKAD